jgi:hypothetical protein
MTPVLALQADSQRCTNREAYYEVRDCARRNLATSLLNLATSLLNLATSPLVLRTEYFS